MGGILFLNGLCYEIVVLIIFFTKGHLTFNCHLESMSVFLKFAWNISPNPPLIVCFTVVST